MGEKALTSMCMLPHGWGHEATSLQSISMLPHCKKGGMVGNRMGWDKSAYRYVVNGLRQRRIQRN